MRSFSVNFLHYELSIHYQCGPVSNVLVVHMLCFALQMSLGYPSKVRLHLRTMNEERMPPLKRELTSQERKTGAI